MARAGSRISNSNTFLLRGMSTTPSWASVDPDKLGTSAVPYAVSNCVGGEWSESSSTVMEIIHPLDKDAHPIFTVPAISADEISPFVESLRKISKSGVHNPLKQPERYLQYGEISRKVCVRFR